MPSWIACPGRGEAEGEGLRELTKEAMERTLRVLLRKEYSAWSYGIVQCLARGTYMGLFCDTAGR